MLFVYIFLAFVVWAALWYFIYYYNYENASNIDDLRKNYKRAQEDLEKAEQDLKEYKMQNDVLRKETEKLQAKNQDYQSVVSELSRYTYIIDEWWKKAQELAKILWVYDKQIEEKVKQLLWDIDKENEEESASYDKKKFF